MSHKRVEIRQQIISILQSTFDEPVYAQRTPDLCDDSAAINVYFAEGASEYDHLYLSTTATFVIGLHRKALASDDQLDQWAQRVSEVIHLNPLQHLVTGITEAGFEYGSDESGQHSSLYLSYELIYQGK